MSLPLNLVGAKIVVLCLHGGPGMDDSYFYPYLDELNPVAEVQSYTQGSTATRDQIVDINFLVKELDEKVKSLTSSGKQVVILAHSFGSVLFLEYLRTVGPNKNIKGAILTNWIYDTEFIKEYLTEHPEEEVENITTDESYLDWFVAHAHFYFTPASINAGREMLQNVKYNAFLYTGITKTFFPSIDFKGLLREVRMPVLSIASSKDAIISTQYIEIGAALIRDCQSVLIDDASHFPFIDQKSKFIDVVKVFLLNLSRR